MGFGRQLLFPGLLRNLIRLNALTGIDGIWTQVFSLAYSSLVFVLMPLRALMGFGRKRAIWLALPSVLS